MSNDGTTTLVIANRDDGQGGPAGRAVEAGPVGASRTSD